MIKLTDLLKLVECHKRIQTELMANPDYFSWTYETGEWGRSDATESEAPPVFLETPDTSATKIDNERSYFSRTYESREWGRSDPTESEALPVLLELPRNTCNQNWEWKKHGTCNISSIRISRQTVATSIYIFQMQLQYSKSTSYRTPGSWTMG